ncbi:DUF5106 domain-containing protein [uncultured Sphingobacterium sp.]|uniref:DUF5106 domain-containing protein n=1 Tax=uncultured Sphingobacterium sp. TaxID=182688 RepID=UPI0025EE04D0|nr:DUF5106 domain-containing protein [uncultured Sphingobacterium sp.]
MIDLKKFKIVKYIILLFVICSCNQTEKHKGEKINNFELKQKEPKKTTLDTYWNDYSFTDTLAIKDPEVSEQRFVNFISLFPYNDLKEVKTSIENLLRLSEKNKKVFIFFKEQYAHYLADPNSPLRNDLYYEYVLSYLANSLANTETERSRYQMQLEMIQKNQIGMQITDFSYLDSKGNIKKLSDMTGKACLLLFYDPSCPHCKDILKELKSSQVLNNLISFQKLSVIAIDPLGDKALWKEYQPMIPNNWINGFDYADTLIKKQLFSIKAYPTIYLTNNQGTILLKDPDYQVVLNLLQRM